jgi:S1-C subfamily serine protease
MKKYVLMILLFLFLLGCSSTLEVNLVSSNSKTLNGYKYVKISDNLNSEWKTPRAELTSLFESNGFRVVNEQDINTFSDEDRLATLICLPNYSLFHYSIDTEYGPMSSLTYYLDIDLWNILGEQLLKIEGKADSRNLDGMYQQMNDVISQYYYGYNPAQLINIKEKFPNIIETDVSKEKLIEYYDKNHLNEIEGIWTESDDNQYTIGIFKDTLYTEREFIGVILESTILLWEPKQVKVELNSTANTNTYSAYYHMSNHEIQGTTAYIDKTGYLNFELTNTISNQKFTSKWVKNYPKTPIKEINKTEIKKPNKSSGSGTLINDAGIIATNYHIVRDANEIIVCFPKINRQYSAKIVLKDVNNDIAFLKIDNFYYEDIFKTQIPFTIQYSSSTKISDEVYTLGYPLGDVLGNTAKYSSGTINSLMGINGDPRTFLISNPVQPGNSGGPLFNKNGKFVGIVMSSLNAEYFFNEAGVIPQNVNFAIKSDYLLNIMSLLPQGDNVLNKDDLISSKTIQEQVNTIEPFIVRILCK